MKHKNLLTLTILFLLLSCSSGDNSTPETLGQSLTNALKSLEFSQFKKILVPKDKLYNYYETILIDLVTPDYEPVTIAFADNKIDEIKENSQILILKRFGIREEFIDSLINLTLTDKSTISDNDDSIAIDICRKHKKKIIDNMDLDLVYNNFINDAKKTFHSIINEGLEHKIGWRKISYVDIFLDQHNPDKTGIRNLDLIISHKDMRYELDVKTFYSKNDKQFYVLDILEIQKM